MILPWNINKEITHDSAEKIRNFIVAMIKLNLSFIKVEENSDSLRAKIRSLKKKEQYK